MCCWDYVATLRFPFLRGPSSTKQKHALQMQGCFFALHRPLRKRAFDGAAQHEKSAQLSLSAFAWL